jgi:hypothetical protein
MGSICRFGSCYSHQNRFPGRNLCYIDNIAFVVSPVATVLVAVAVVVVADYFSIQDSYVVLLCIRLMVAFWLFFFRKYTKLKVMTNKNIVYFIFGVGSYCY